MSRTITTTKEQTPSNEFRDKLLGLINDHKKRKDIELIDGGRFIEELSRQFREIGQFERLLYKHKNDDFLASSINMDEETRGTYNIMCSIAEAAKNSLNDCETYALFLYLSDSLRNPILFKGWIFQWIIEVTKRFKKNESVILKFVYGFAINYCELFEILCKNINLKHSVDESSLPYGDRISLPESDVSGFFVHILRQDYKQIVSIQRKYIHLEEESLCNGNEEHGWLIEHFGRLIFPNVPTDLLIEVYISFLHARLANYLVSASRMNEDQIKGKKELKKALDHYEDNSYAIALQASLSQWIRKANRRQF